MKGETIMFKEGDIIRRITEDGSGSLLRVTEDETDNPSALNLGYVYVADEAGNNVSSVDVNDYELVSALTQQSQETKPMKPNVSGKTIKKIHEDISKMYIQVAQYMESSLDGASIELKIDADYSSGQDLDVRFSARVGYESWITSDDLFKSAEIAIHRYGEDKKLKPLRIAMYREAT
jgi:hypothetical protein